MGARRAEAFSTCHASVPAACFAVIVAASMFAVHPVLVGISLAGALAFSLLARGVRPTLMGLRWQLPMLALVCLLNPLFSASGSTLVCKLGPRSIYLESLAFGACMGALMAASVLWLEGAAAVLTQDRLLSLAGRRARSLPLVVSMAAQLVPQLLERARTVQMVDAACTAARASGDESAGQRISAGCAEIADLRVAGSGGDAVGRIPSAEDAGGGTAPHTCLEGGRASCRAWPRGKGAPLRRIYGLGLVRTSGVLLGWALEDSLVRADAMRARGWESGCARTSYRPDRFTSADMARVLVIAALALVAALLAWVACSQWRFYPTMPRLVAWWGYLPFAALCALPSFAELAGRRR